MTAYRDELVRAVDRVDAIDAELGAHRREVDALRARLAAPDVSTGGAPRRRWIGLAVGVAAVAALNGAYVLRRAATAPALMQRSVDEAADRVLGAGVRALPEPDGSELRGGALRGSELRGGDPVPLPDASQAATLRARCARTTTDAEGLVAGMSRIDLGTCVGCDCCAAGAFPTQGDPSRFEAGSPAATCWECSAVVALGRAGIVTTTGPASSPLHGVYGVGFTLEQPAKAFAIQLHGRVVPPPMLRGPGPRAVGLVAYDATGEPIDAVRVEVSRESAPEDGPTLLVEACDGERIHRVDFGSDDPLREIVGVHVLPAE